MVYSSSCWIDQTRALGKGRQKYMPVDVVPCMPVLAMSAEEEDVPEELEEQCTKCHMALAGIEQLLQSVMSVSRTQMEDKVSFQLMPSK